MKSPCGRRILIKLIEKQHNLTFILLLIVLFVFFLSSGISRTNSQFDSKLFTVGVNDTIFIYDTVYLYDTTYVYDTIWLSNPNMESIQNDSNFPQLKNIWANYSGDSFDTLVVVNYYPRSAYFLSLDFFGSPTLAFHQFSFDPLFNEIAKINQSSLTPGISNTFGLFLNFHHQNSQLSSGIQFSRFREKFDFLATGYKKDTVMSYRYSIIQEIKIDSIAILNIDTLLATGDSVYYYIKDTDYILSLDSELIEKIDSSEINFKEKSSNRYSYIEIPLIYRFDINRYNYSVSPEFGLITSFFLDSKGKIVSLTNVKNSEDININTKLSKINLSIHLGVRINYRLSSRFEFFTAGYYRRNINSIYKDYPVISRFNTFGINMGIRYKIIY